MERVPFSDVIGIGGIVFAIVLLVLDKAGKLKGGWLFGLLCLAGAMTLFIAIGNSWVIDAPNIKWKLWRGGLMAALVVFTYSGLAIWISTSSVAESHEGIPNEPPQTPRLRSHIDITTLRLHPVEVPHYVEIAYRNAGVIPTKQEIVIANVFCRPAIPDQKSIDALFAEFVKGFNETPKANINWRPARDPGEGFTDKYYGDEMNRINISELLASRQWVYFIGGILHSDATGHYRKALCYVWFSPNMESSIDQSKIMENWKSCVPSGAKAWEQAASDDKY
ncbi:MAG TPA: hypothetical protein VOA64_01715 [Candidatus Dormibacteraeota bacterium]|nr:hypothetical protein [Candidatus Dormibacteraeota bacterium]